MTDPLWGPLQMLQRQCSDGRISSTYIQSKVLLSNGLQAEGCTLPVWRVGSCGEKLPVSPWSIWDAAHRTFECPELNSRMRKVPLAQSSFLFHLAWFNLAGIYLGLALEGHVGEVETIE